MHASLAIFSRCTVLACAALSLLALPPRVLGQSIALTFDDGPDMADTIGLRPAARNEATLSQLKDSVYSMRPDIVPAGKSILWALAKEKGVAGLRYPGEDEVYEKPILDRLHL